MTCRNRSNKPLLDSKAEISLGMDAGEGASNEDKLYMEEYGAIYLLNWTSPVYLIVTRKYFS